MDIPMNYAFLCLCLSSNILTSTRKNKEYKNHCNFFSKYNLLSLHFVLWYVICGKNFHKAIKINLFLNFWELARAAPVKTLRTRGRNEKLLSSRRLKPILIIFDYSNNISIFKITFKNGFLWETAKFSYFFHLANLLQWFLWEAMCSEMLMLDIIRVRSEAGVACVLLPHSLFAESTRSCCVSACPWFQVL